MGQISQMARRTRQNRRHATERTPAQPKTTLQVPHLKHQKRPLEDDVVKTKEQSLYITKITIILPITLQRQCTPTPTPEQPIIKFPLPIKIRSHAKIISKIQLQHRQIAKTKSKE